jgi:50S ribosomal subunit-associated GTPase HflX
MALAVCARNLALAEQKAADLVAPCSACYTVLNKTDRLSPLRKASLEESRPGAALVSALTGEGLENLRGLLRSRLEFGAKAVRLRFPERDTQRIAGVYRAGRVLRHEVKDGEVHLEVEMPGRLLERYRGFMAGGFASHSSSFPWHSSPAQLPGPACLCPLGRTTSTPWPPRGSSDHQR